MPKIICEDLPFMMASNRSDDSSHPETKPIDPHQPQGAAPAGLAPLPPSGVITGFDWVLALLALTLAFLSVSFSIRNSDYWLHLATGRLIAQGDYRFGTDPFSYVGSERTWVNHSWLFDWLLYQAHKADGLVVGIAKGAALVLAAVLMLLARRPGLPYFPGMICLILAAVGAAPRLAMQPIVASVVCLTALLCLIIRGAPKPGWRFAISVAILFWFWSNLDQWFFLGPIFLVLYTLGQYLRKDADVEPTTLWKGVALGVLACMANPHHVRTWTLPAELIDRGLAEIFANDSEFNPYFRSAFSAGSLDFAGSRENPINLYSLIALLALGLIGFVLNRRQASIGLALVALAATALGAAHLRAIPLMAFTLAPIAALQLAQWGRQVADTPRSERAVRSLQAARSIIRAAAVLGSLLLIALSYPGWLHPIGLQRRWAWHLEPNPSMVRMAEQIHAWRIAGQLPDAARMLNFQPDFAHYVAWFAPGTRTYFDTRLTFHRPEAADYAALRASLLPRTARERTASPFDLRAFLTAQQISFAVTVHPDRDRNDAIWQGLLLDERDSSRGPEWSLWAVHGRAVALGWNRQQVVPKGVMEQLRYDALRQAFVTDARPLPPPDIRPPILARSIWEQFISAPPTPSPHGEESAILMRYRDLVLSRASQQQRRDMALGRFMIHGRFLLPALDTWLALPFLNHPVSTIIPTIVPFEANALALQAVRAARRAIAESPDHPDGYFYLADAYAQYAGYGFTSDIQEVVVTASLMRCRARVPDDPNVRGATISVVDLCDRLRALHLNASPRRLDLMLDATRLGAEYLRANIDDLERILPAYEGEERRFLEYRIDQQQRLLTQWEKEIPIAEANLKKADDQFVNLAAGLASPLERAGVARQNGLVRTAINELYRAHEALQKQLESGGPPPNLSPSELANQLALHAELIELLWFDGRAEEAMRILDAIDTDETRRSMTSSAVRERHLEIRQRALTAINPRNPPFSRFDGNPAAHYRSLRQAASLIAGDLQQVARSQVDDAREIRAEFDDYRQKHFPQGPPRFEDLPANPFYDLIVGIFHQPSAAPVLIARQAYYGKIEGLLRLAIALRDVHVRAALSFLEAGDVDAAEHHFRRALEAPEWSPPTGAQRVAQEFLRSIQKARQAPAGL